MRLLLRKDVPKLGQVGDVVEVAAGYGRNYLVPMGLAVEPSAANLREIEEEKRRAAEERARHLQNLKQEAGRLAGTEITIPAAANPEGHLYGSVTARDIARALINEGHAVNAQQVKLERPIRQLDTVAVPVEFDEDIRVEIKVWVVPEKTAGTLEDESIASGQQPDEEGPRQPEDQP